MTVGVAEKGETLEKIVRRYERENWKEALYEHPDDRASGKKRPDHVEAGDERLGESAAKDVGKKDATAAAHIVKGAPAR